jgi:ribosomal protein L16 Arg81 hydroxylase
LAGSAEARETLEKFRQVRQLMGQVEDKEVIAPPIFVGDHSRQRFWEAPYFKTVVGIAASLILVILVARFADLKVHYADQQLSIGFGTAAQQSKNNVVVASPTATEVQTMINDALKENNEAIEASWAQTQEKLDASVKYNLAANSEKVDQLVKASAAASQDQIRQYVAGLQAENLKIVKNYFQLTSTEQKQYIENLLVDFAKYLQQQRKDDLQVVQTQLNSIQKNTDIFKQETEQILTSIITTVGSQETLGTRN